MIAPRLYRRRSMNLFLSQMTRALKLSPANLWSFSMHSPESLSQFHVENNGRHERIRTAVSTGDGEGSSPYLTMLRRVGVCTGPMETPCRP